MQLRASHLVQASPEEKTQHDFRLNVAMVVDEIFESENPAIELAVKMGQIREDVLKLFLQKSIPAIMAGTGLSSAYEGAEHTDFKADTDGENEFVGNDLHSTLDMQIHISTARPMNTAQAINASRLHLSSSIAEYVVHALRNRFHGTQASDNETSVRERAGVPIRYAVRDERRGNPGNN